MTTSGSNSRKASHKAICMILTCIRKKGYSFVTDEIPIFHHLNRMMLKSITLILGYKVQNTVKIYIQLCPPWQRGQEINLRV
jgi:hypothetical protein